MVSIYAIVQCVLFVVVQVAFLYYLSHSAKIPLEVNG